MITYGSLGEFYRAEGLRVLSAEIGYGGRWRLKGWPGNFRVGYIETTGEVYAEHHRADGGSGAVLVLGIILRTPAGTASTTTAPTGSSGTAGSAGATPRASPS